MAKSAKQSAPKGLVFGEATYRAGALERLGDARILKERQFALSMYAGGLAVEGMLRSLCCLKSREFDEKHDLRKFAVRVEEFGLLRPGRDDDFVEIVNEVAMMWRNNFRFAGYAQLERMLKQTKALSKRKTVKQVCGEFFDVCSDVVGRCEFLWQSYHKRSSKKS